MSAPGSALRAAFAAFVAEHALIEPGEPVVVGVSGGVDSAVLLYLLAESHRLVAAHVDHGLRPESAEDAAFVEALADRLGVPFRATRVTLPEGENRQAAGRRARYAFLAEAAEAVGASAVAVAHHRDDLAETLLLNLLRGAGPRGWAPMPLVRPLGEGARLVRPLRFARRAEIEAFARAEGIDWREDPSNASRSYRRNAIRHDVMPLLQQHFGEAVPDRLAAAAEHAEALRTAADATLAAVRQSRDALDLDRLRALPVPLRRGALLDALTAFDPSAPRTAAVAARLDALVEAQVGRRVEFGQTWAWRDRDRIRFTPPPAPFEAVFSPGESVETPFGRFETEGGASGALPEDGEAFDADRLAGPLGLRTWRAGDRLVPFGRTGSRLVSDLLTDAKVPSSERAEALVLTAGDDVIWLVGVRRGAAAPVTSDTRRRLTARWHPR